MTLPDLVPCAHCGRSLRTPTRDGITICRGCGSGVKIFRIRTTVGSISHVREQLVTIGPAEVGKYRGGTEDPSP